MAVYLECTLPQPDSIRLMILHPSSGLNRDIHCELLSTTLSSLAENASIVYTTLSYVWGSTNTSRTIFISRQSFEVGANLFSALQNIRRQDRPSYLWVDAICIDQNNLDERSSQVKWMSKIYATASETIVYLGPSDESKACQSAWNFLELRSSWAMNKHRDPDIMLPRTREKVVNFKTAYNDVLVFIMSREWFHRIWVIQEVVVSKRLSIQCGERRIPWDDFCRTLLLYFSPLQSTNPHEYYSGALGSLLALTSGNNSRNMEFRPGWETVARNNPRWKELTQPVKELCQMRLIYQKANQNPIVPVPRWILNDPLAHFVNDDSEYRHGSLRLVNLLSSCRKFRATDPRDKIFALLGISLYTSVERVLYEGLTDYSMSVHRTYRKVTRFIIANEMTFDVLSQAGQTSTDDDLDFASWAGKWSQRDFPSVSALSRLGGESDELIAKRRDVVPKHCAWADDGRVFGCTGGIVGEVIATRSLISGGPHLHDPVDNVDSWSTDKFIPIATSTIKDTLLTLLEKDADFITTKTIKKISGGHFSVSISSQSRLHPERAPTVNQIFIAGGDGFLGDVYALREGRILGLVRSAYHVLSESAVDEDAVFSWAVLPRFAQVGDWVVTITGCRVLFLVYRPTEVQEKEEIEKAFRAALPKDGDEDAEVVNCRLRGECRVSGFEEMWEPWRMSEEMKQRPWMTYAGYYCKQFTCAIFAMH